MAPANRGWILDAICKELAARWPSPTQFHWGLRPLPRSAAYFFSHYSLYERCLDDPAVRRARSFVWFTHPNFPVERGHPTVEALARATMVVSHSSMHARSLVAAGIEDAKVAVAIPGVDPGQFARHSRGGGDVGFCSAYYPRKAPDRILALVQALPHRQFRLLGRGWQSAPELASLSALPNFAYREDEYGTYPAFYAGIDVFVSPSTMEGGPVPLVEAMMSNCVPVATRTGCAPDVIRDGVNGFLVDVDAPVSVFADRVEAAIDLDADVRTTVEHLTWDAFAQRVIAVTGASG